MHCLLVHSFLLAIIGVAQASVTVYGPHVQQPLGTGTATAPAASYTGSASYDDVVLIPPPVPNSPPPTSFISDEALAESDQGPTMTFATTTGTKPHNTATIDPAALATSNGNKGLADSLAGTSQGGGINGAFGLSRALPSVGALIAGAALVIRMNALW